MTAAAFTKGLLDLEGHLTPILASLVRKNTLVNQLLDDSTDAAAAQSSAKSTLRELLLEKRWTSGI